MHNDNLNETWNALIAKLTETPNMGFNTTKLARAEGYTKARITLEHKRTNRIHTKIIYIRDINQPKQTEIYYGQNMEIMRRSRDGDWVGGTVSTSKMDYIILELELM